MADSFFTKEKFDNDSFFIKEKFDKIFLELLNI